MTANQPAAAMADAYVDMFTMANGRPAADTAELRAWMFAPGGELSAAAEPYFLFETAHGRFPASRNELERWLATPAARDHAFQIALVEQSYAAFVLAHGRRPVDGAELGRWAVTLH
jgi:hypothetical protein